MTDFDPRAEGSFPNGDSHPQTAGRDLAERSEAKHSMSAAGRNTEVIPKRTKRRFAAAEKLRILAAADACTKHGELGALMRREGLYSSQIAAWRTLRDQGELGALTDKKRGRKAAAVNPLAAKLAEAEKKNRSLEKKLEQAEAIIGFQKKFLEIVGKLPNPEQDETKL